MSEHTPGPWKANTFEVRTKAGKRGICHCGIGYGNGEESESNARRIVAAVNTCEGIPTEALEAGVVADLLKACKWINRIVTTAGDGGRCWCAIRDQQGASNWGKNLEAAVAAATEK